MTRSLRAAQPYQKPARLTLVSRQPTSDWLFVSFIVAHVAIALLMNEYPDFATVHALAVLAVGLWWAGNRRIERVGWVAAYIAGAEVLWRMTDAAVNWEFGKYALSLVLIVALISTRRLRPPALVFAYFALLLPAVWITAFAFPFAEARQMISFNLSGPFALLLSIWFFRRCVVLDRAGFTRLVLVLVAPVVGIAAVGAFSTLTAAHLTFTTASNFATSGGFGPNQVSAMLGLGMIGCAFGIAFGERAAATRIALIAAFCFMLVQCVLTFSRTGLVLAIIGIAAFLPFMLRTARQRLAVIGFFGLLFVFVQFWMVPILDDFTQGVFAERFTDADLSNRDHIMAIDLQIWTDHPVFGIGAGGGNEAREEYGFRRAAAHTEYTRMLAEHGVFGLVALVLLLALGGIPVLRRQAGPVRGVHLALVVWVFAFMMVSAFRLAAPALLLGVCWAPLMLMRNNVPENRQWVR